MLVLGACLLTGRGVVAQSDLTISKLQAAESAIEHAFNMVLDAEKVGANTTVLISRLNVAADLLAQAKNDYKSDNFTLATNKADSILPITQEVSSLAQAAGTDALSKDKTEFWYTLVYSLIASVVFVLVLFAVWRWFKSRYFKNLANSKPLVNHSET